jgi:glycosyltransferase involved in cell wall biosynthesis
MSASEMDNWVSFCISTYKRPSFLQEQITLLLGQTNSFFEIVISDNDPDGSARVVTESFNDKRIRYFQNEENIGMIKSFNKSMERATTDYVVMVTDDDPVEKDFLSFFYPLIQQYPDCSLYGGFNRAGKLPSQIEKITKEDFLREMLDPDRTTSILWSSCILRKRDAMAVGRIPDFGSPHLADHALLALTGSRNGAVVVNKMYSNVTFHEGNFSKFNFDYYVKGCKGFYTTMSSLDNEIFARNKPVIIKHLDKWFISNIFNLKNYYLARQNKDMLAQIDACAREIISFPFMKKSAVKYHFKNFVLKIKKRVGVNRPGFKP